MKGNVVLKPGLQELARDIGVFPEVPPSCVRTLVGATSILLTEPCSAWVPGHAQMAVTDVEGEERGPM